LIKNQILEASDSNHENLAAIENVDQIRIFLKNWLNRTMNYNMSKAALNLQKIWQDYQSSF
jgi:hypothetical protein